MAQSSGSETTRDYSAMSARRPPSRWALRRTPSRTHPHRSATFTGAGLARCARSSIRARPSSSRPHRSRARERRPQRPVLVPQVPRCAPPSPRTRRVAAPRTQSGRGTCRRDARGSRTRPASRPPTQPFPYNASHRAASTLPDGSGMRVNRWTSGSVPSASSPSRWSCAIGTRALSPFVIGRPGREGVTSPCSQRSSRQRGASSSSRLPHGSWT